MVLGERPALPRRLHLALSRHAELRYGENPHQKAALYIPAGQEAAGLAGARQLQGKELSYNNLVDLDAAWALAQEFAQPAAVIVKHNNPCGTAEQPTLVEAYRQALACDPVSAFGGVLAFSRPLDGKTAEEVGKLFAECIVAPGYEAAARAAFAGKKNLRLMEIGADEPAGNARLELKCISGGVLVQDRDTRALDEAELKVATKRAPTREEYEALLFAWKVSKHVKSNAIVFARAIARWAVGAGQMSRVDSVKIAVMKAQESLAGSIVVLRRTFFFPMVCRGMAARAGATAVIQPGGLGARRGKTSGRRPSRSGDAASHRGAAFPALSVDAAGCGVGRCGVHRWVRVRASGAGVQRFSGHLAGRGVRGVCVVQDDV